MKPIFENTIQPCSSCESAIDELNTILSLLQWANNIKEDIKKHQVTSPFCNFDISFHGSHFWVNNKSNGKRVLFVELE